MMTEGKEIESVLVHLRDLRDQCERRYMHTESGFLNEEEQAAARREFPESALVRYEGGYPGARKKKVIFRRDEEDDLCDVVCITAKTDLRFRTVEHRDILGALMSLQIDRHSFGDLWRQDEDIFLYTSQLMGRFLCDNLIRIANQNVSFSFTDEHPVQVFRTKKIRVVIASERADAVVAALAHCSRSEAKQMIRAGRVQLNHVTLVDADELCDNNVTISIRGTGRFTYLGASGKTRKDRITAEFLQSI